MKFTIQGADSRTGREKTVTIDADNEQDATAKANAMGLYVLRPAKVAADLVRFTRDEAFRFGFWAALGAMWASPVVTLIPALIALVIFVVAGPQR